jgi:hypothetical protein
MSPRTDWTGIIKPQRFNPAVGNGPHASLPSVALVQIGYEANDGRMGAQGIVSDQQSLCRQRIHDSGFLKFR